MKLLWNIEYYHFIVVNKLSALLQREFHVNKYTLSTVVLLTLTVITVWNIPRTANFWSVVNWLLPACISFAYAILTAVAHYAFEQLDFDATEVLSDHDKEVQILVRMLLFVTTYGALMLLVRNESEESIANFRVYLLYYVFACLILGNNVDKGDRRSLHQKELGHNGAN